VKASWWRPRYRLRPPREKRPFRVTPLRTAAYFAAAAFATIPARSIAAQAHDDSLPRAIPRYGPTAVSSGDAELLRRAFGIEDPTRLYLSDSADGATLKYDTKRKTCGGCLVNSYHVGYVSVRLPGETWEEVEHRVQTTKSKVFTGNPHPESTSTADLDPDIRSLAEAMLRDAKDAGFRFRIMATYRSPLRQAFLMAKGRGRTHTLTSNHSYGRALDIVIDNGNRGNKRTKRDWIAFRRWVLNYKTPAGETFHILGNPESSWDWSHVEVPSAALGFHSVNEAVTRARECLAPGSSVLCDFQPHLAFEAPSPLVPASHMSAHESRARNSGR
jgi:hypothetical protein